MDLENSGFVYHFVLKRCELLFKDVTCDCNSMERSAICTDAESFARFSMMYVFLKMNLESYGSVYHLYPGDMDFYSKM